MMPILHVLILASVGQAPQRPGDLASLFEAIRMVETGSHDQPHKAVGDGGRSLGPYQISRAYLRDSGLPGHWDRCRDKKFSEAVMLAYWRRHCPEALRTRDFQTLARVHNGGPIGHRKAATLRYWTLVNNILRREQVALRPSPSNPKRRSRLVI